MTCSFAAGMAWWVTIVLGGLFLELAFAYGFFRFYASRTNRSVVTLIWGTAAAATLAGVIGILSALPFAGLCPWDTGTLAAVAGPPLAGVYCPW